MPLFREEELKPVTTDINLEVESFVVKKQRDLKKYIPDNIVTEETVLSVNFHPEKKLVALGCVDGQTYIYEYSLNENKQKAVFQQHIDSCREVCFSDNGKYLLSVSSDKTINSINVEKELMQFEIQNAHKYPIQTFICCTDNLIASGDDEGYVKVWDTRKGGKAVASFGEHAEYVSDFDFEDEGMTLYSTSADGTLCIQDLRKMKVRDISKPYEKDFLCCCEMERGENIAVGTSKGDILVFDYGKWEAHASKISTNMESVDTMLFISEKMMACGSVDGTIRLFTLNPKKMVTTLCTSEDPIYKMSVSPDGSYIATCGGNNIVRFWNSAGLYGGNLSAKIEAEEEMEKSEGTKEEEEEGGKGEDKNTAQSTVTSQDTTSEDASDKKGKKRKKNTEKVDDRKRKRVYNSQQKAFFHDMVNEY